MDIKDRIKKLGRYFKEMQITTIDGGQVIYVVVSFPREWVIDDDIAAKYNVTVQEGTNVGEFYFCADIEIGENAIFDAIEYNIEKMQDAIERAQLLREKTLELKHIFEDEAVTLEELRALRFLYRKEDEPSLVITPSKRGRKPSETVTTEIQETVSENIIKEE